MFTGRGPRIFPGPWSRPCRWVGDREAIEQSIGTDARETLHNMQLLGCSAESGFVCEVGRIDDERIAFPAANGIAHPVADRFRKMLGVHTDDTSIVDHLGK